MRRRQVRGLLQLALLALPSAAAGFGGSPPDDRVGLCGTGPTCADCHDRALMTSSALIELSLNGVPAPAPPPAAGTYVPDTDYAVLIRIVEGEAAARCQHPAFTLACDGVTPCPENACRFGFEMTALVAATCGSPFPAPAGCFTMTTPDTQDVGFGGCPTGLQYVAQTCAGSVPSAPPGERTWTFDWRSPPAGTGRVHFFYYVNSANANERSNGDQPYPGEFVLDESPAVPGCDLLRAAIASVSPPPPAFKPAILFADTSSCAPEAVPPRPAFIPDYTTLATALVEPVEGGPALAVYEVACPCSSRTLLVRKSGTDVIVDWQ